MATYAAYAGNMDPERMALRAPHSPWRSTGWLQGWRLTFGGEDRGIDGALSTIVEDPDGAVFVSLFEVNEGDEGLLDDWEGGDLDVYRKIHVRVATLEGDVLAWAYVLDAYEGGLPSAHYLGLLADAAEASGAPADYVADLRSRPCRSVG